MLCSGADRPAEAVGAELDAYQIVDCRTRLGQLGSLVRADRQSRHRRASGRYDAVVCMEVLEHVVDLEPVIDRLWRVLAPDGTLLVSVPVETGLPLLVKQAARRMAGWRGLGDYADTTGYSWREYGRACSPDRRLNTGRVPVRRADAVPRSQGLQLDGAARPSGAGGSRSRSTSRRRSRGSARISRPRSGSCAQGKRAGKPPIISALSSVASSDAGRVSGSCDVVVVAAVRQDSTPLFGWRKAATASRCSRNIRGSASPSTAPECWRARRSRSSASVRQASSTSFPVCASTRRPANPVEYSTPIGGSGCRRSRAVRPGAGCRGRSAMAPSCIAGASPRSRSTRTASRSRAPTGRFAAARACSPAAPATHCSAGSGSACPACCCIRRRSSCPPTHAGDVEVHFGADAAPRGFAWAVPVERANGASSASA